MIKEKFVTIKLAHNLIKKLQKLGYRLKTHQYRGETRITTNIPIRVRVDHLSSKSHAMVTRICDNCGDKRKMRFEKCRDLCFKCSTYKISLALRGKNNGMFGKKGPLSPKWNPNKTIKEKLEGKLRFHSKESQRWSKQIKEIFNFICQKCKNRGGKLVSHHVESWHSNVELRLDISNGICLCEICHKKFHKLYGKKNNTRKQLNKFLRSKND